jgi:hypothetical protein
MLKIYSNKIVVDENTSELSKKIEMLEKNRIEKNKNLKCRKEKLEQIYNQVNPFLPLNFPNSDNESVQMEKEVEKNKNKNKNEPTKENPASSTRFANSGIF